MGAGARELWGRAHGVALVPCWKRIEGWYFSPSTCNGQRKCTLASAIIIYLSHICSLAHQVRWAIRPWPNWLKLSWTQKSYLLCNVHALCSCSCQNESVIESFVATIATLTSLSFWSFWLVYTLGFSAVCKFCASPEFNHVDSAIYVCCLDSTVRFFLPLSCSEMRKLLERCAATALSSKLVAAHKDFFATMVVDAVMLLDELLPLNMIGIKKVKGGALQDSRLIAGVAFKKTFSYAGFEMQRKKYNNPKIALLNVELELKSEKENAEIRLDNVQVRNWPFLLDEWALNNMPILCLGMWPPFLSYMPVCTCSGGVHCWIRENSIREKMHFVDALQRESSHVWQPVYHSMLVVQSLLEWTFATGIPEHCRCWVGYSVRQAWQDCPEWGQSCAVQAANRWCGYTVLCR